MVGDDSVLLHEILDHGPYPVVSELGQEVGGDAASSEGYHGIECGSSGHRSLRLIVPEHDVEDCLPYSYNFSHGFMIIRRILSP